MLLFNIFLLLITSDNSSGQRYKPRYQPVPNLAKTLKVHGFTKFYSLLRQAKLYSVLYERDEYTLFVPSNAVIGNHTRRIENVKSYVEFHIFKGKHELNNIKDGTILKSYYNNAAIFNKVYDFVTKTTNLWIQGYLVTVSNIKAGNSLIYIVHDFITNPSQTVYTYLKESGNHLMFFELLKKQRIYFQFPFGTTVIAPLDLAFTKLPKQYKDRIFSNELETRKFLRNHVISRPMCRHRLFHTTGWSTVINSIGRSLTLYQDNYNTHSMFINGGSVITTNVLSDGFVYGVTEIMLADVDFKILETLRDLDCHTFLQHLITTGHMATLNSILELHTVFAPTDKAFEELPEDTINRLTNDKDFLRTVIMHHVVLGRYFSENFSTYPTITTTAIDTQTQIRSKLHVYNGEEISTVNNGIITNRDNLALNGVIHIIDRVLIPPTKTIYELLESKKMTRLFMKALRNTNTTLLNQVKNVGENFQTIFAPNNKAMKKFYNTFGNDLRSQATDNINEIFLTHFVPRPFFTTSMMKGKNITLQTVAVNSKTSRKIRLLNDEVRGVYITNYDASLTRENIIATNGVLHVVNKVFSDQEF